MQFMNQREAEQLRALDEAKAGKLERLVSAIPRRQTCRGIEEPVPLVVAHRIDGNPGALGKFSDLHDRFLMIVAKGAVWTRVQSQAPGSRG